MNQTVTVTKSFIKAIYQNEIYTKVDFYVLFYLLENLSMDDYTELRQVDVCDALGLSKMQVSIAFKRLILSNVIKRNTVKPKLYKLNKQELLKYN